MADFANEAGHWYLPDGSPYYTVKAVNGEERAATLRDARRIGALPSVTAILKLAAAPQLEKWKRKQTLLAALTLPRKNGEPESDWLARIELDAEEQAKKARELGSGIHGSLERHYRGQAPENEHYAHVQGAKAVIAANCEAQVWQPERSFAHPSGYGGKVDLHSQDWVLDFKTKAFGPLDKMETWDDHACQLAAYRRGLGVDKARCAIVYVSTTDPGLCVLREIDEKDLVRGLVMFDCLLAYFIAKTRYDPRTFVTKEAA